MAWPGKRLSVVGRGGQIGRGGSRGAEVGSLAAWAGLGRKERAAGLSFCLGDRRGQGIHGIREIGPSQSGLRGNAGTSDLSFRAWRSEPDPRCS